jgi:hypothetical protein
MEQFNYSQIMVMMTVPMKDLKISRKEKEVLEDF